MAGLCSLCATNGRLLRRNIGGIANTCQAQSSARIGDRESLAVHQNKITFESAPKDGIGQCRASLLHASWSTPHHREDHMICIPWGVEQFQITQVRVRWETIRNLLTLYY